MLEATALEAGVIADPGKKTFPDNQGAYTSLELFQLGVFWMDILSDSCHIYYVCFPSNVDFFHGFHVRLA